jgi:hypothetical protein
MGMAHILMDLNISGGLVDSIFIQLGKNTYHQSIDYEGIPFRCGRCHSYDDLSSADIFLEGSIFWAQAYFWRRICFGERHFLETKT